MVRIVGSGIELGNPYAIDLVIRIFLGHSLLSWFSFVAVSAPWSLEENEHVSVEIHDILLEGLAHYYVHPLLSHGVTLGSLSTLDGWLQFIGVVLSHEILYVVRSECITEQKVFVGSSVGDDNSWQVFDAKLLFHAWLLIVIEIHKRVFAFEGFCGWLHDLHIGIFGVISFDD